MAELVIRVDKDLASKAFRGLLAASMFFAAVPELASESVTLTTYYPAPSGVYAQMITTGNTYLARDGGFVDVGTSVSPSGGTKMAVMGGNMGVGTTSPGYLFEVAGSMHASSYAGGSVFTGSVGGYYGGTPEINANGDNHTGGGILVSDDGGFYDYNDGPVTFNGSTGLRIAGNNGPGSAGYLSFPGGAITGTYGIVPTGYAGWASYGTGAGGAAIYNDGGSYRTLMLVGNNSGGAGIRRVGVWDELDVNGTLNASSSISSSAGCWAVNVNLNGTTTGWNGGCGGGNYLTLIGGFYSAYVAVPFPYMGNPEYQSQVIDALCCPCPAGGCRF